MKRVAFYIDGFNFYYGLKETANKNSANPDSTNWKKYYWLDFVKFCSSFLQNGETLAQVKYFTAKPKGSNGRAQRQLALLQANERLNPKLFETIWGRYSNKTLHCKARCRQTFTTWEEKQSDVNVAISILEDFMTSYCDKTILISADSDLIPPLSALQRISTGLRKKHEIEVFLPPSRFSSEMYNKYSSKKLDNYKSRFNKALLPFEFIPPDGGKKIIIPPEWKTYFT